MRSEIPDDVDFPIRGHRNQLLAAIRILLHQTIWVAVISVVDRSPSSQVFYGCQTVIVGQSRFKLGRIQVGLDSGGRNRRHGLLPIWFRLPASHSSSPLDTPYNGVQTPYNISGNLTYSSKNRNRRRRSAQRRSALVPLRYLCRLSRRFVNRIGLKRLPSR